MMMTMINLWSTAFRSDSISTWLLELKHLLPLKYEWGLVMTGEDVSGNYNEKRDSQKHVPTSSNLHLCNQSKVTKRPPLLRRAYCSQTGHHLTIQLGSAGSRPVRAKSIKTISKYIISDTHTCRYPRLWAETFRPWCTATTIISHGMDIKIQFFHGHWILALNEACLGWRCLWWDGR